MLHIDDIKDRLNRNSEPQEVTEMRNHILDSFKNLEFIEEGHIYNVHNADGTMLKGIPSASSIIHRFEPYVDWDEKAVNYAEKHGYSVEQVKRMWKENNIRATNNGKSVHLFGEFLQQFVTYGEPDMCEVLKPQYEDGFFIPYGPKQEAIMNYWADLFEIEDIYPLLPECKMYMPLGNKFGINEVFCGTADITLAYKFKGKWSIILHDYKTNASLTNSYNQNNNVMMLPPFDNLINEAQSHYTIQLTLYSMMLENLGYDVIDRKLIWLKSDGTYEKVQLPYIKDEVIESFKSF